MATNFMGQIGEIGQPIFICHATCILEQIRILMHQLARSQWH